MMHIVICLRTQTLTVWEGERRVKVYPVSTATNGAGERKASYQTPRGRHVIRAKIGAGLPRAAVLSGRRWTGEICDADMYANAPQRDWILSRILWLSGCERGRNRLGEVDTMQRYIYIHGTPDAEPMGVAQSHGCIRMRNDDVMELFERVPCYTLVNIIE